MKLKILLCLLLFGLLALPCLATNVNPSADAYIDLAHPNTNYGSSSTMHSFDSDGYEISWIKFTVPAHPSNAKIYLYFNGGIGDHTASIYKASNSWDENTLTWNNMPSIDATMINQSHIISTGWVTFDVSSVVVDSPSEQTYTFIIRSDKAGYDDKYDTKEGTNKPYVSIDGGVTSSPPNNTTTQSNSTNQSTMLFNSKTNNDANAFLVNTGDIVNFGIAFPNSGSIAGYTWAVNKIVQSNTGSSFTFRVPSFDITHPYTGIWEISVTGTYSNGTTLTREWLISALTVSQAPDFIDYFTDCSTNHAGQTDPWGRSLHSYGTGSTLARNGYLSAGTLYGDGTIQTSITSMNWDSYEQ